MALLLALASGAQADRGTDGDLGSPSPGLRDSYDPRADGHRSSRPPHPGQDQRPGRGYEWRPHPGHRQPAPPRPGYPGYRDRDQGGWPAGGGYDRGEGYGRRGGYERYQSYEGREVYRVQGGGSIERSTLAPSDARPQRGVNEIINMVERRYGGKVVGVEAAGDHYRVRLLQRDGRVRTLHVPVGGY